jgi:uncharacterized damage-inducible protein DinB
MSAAQNTRMLTHYTAWANARLYAMLLSLPDAQALFTRAGGSGSMASILGHAYVVDLIWKAHLEGLPHGLTSRAAEKSLGLSVLRDVQAEVDQWYVDYADRLSVDAHEEVVHFKFVDGAEGAMSRSHMLLHVVNHKTYHRGYVADLLYQAGGSRERSPGCAWFPRRSVPRACRAGW